MMIKARRGGICNLCEGARRAAAEADSVEYIGGDTPQPRLHRGRGTHAGFTGRGSQGTWQKAGQSVWCNGHQLSLHSNIPSGRTEPVITTVMMVAHSSNISQAQGPCPGTVNITVIKTLSVPSGSFQASPGRGWGDLQTGKDGRVTNAIHSDEEGGLPRKAS